MTGNGEVPAKEEATENVRELDRLFSHLENSAKKLCTVTTGRVDRSHISSRKARKLNATHQIMYHSSHLVCPRVLVPH